MRRILIVLTTTAALAAPGAARAQLLATAPRLERPTPAALTIAAGAIVPGTVAAPADSTRRPYTVGERVLLTAVGALGGALLGLRHDRRGFVCGDGDVRCAGDVREGVITLSALGATLGAAAGPHGSCEGRRRLVWAGVAAGAVGVAAALNDARRSGELVRGGLLVPLAMSVAPAYAVDVCRARR